MADRIDLFEYSEEQLLQDKELTHYQVLNLSEYATPDEVKKAYRRTSLKYHPDKTGRGDDDYVFLAVKDAYDTLMDHGKRQAYDSTVVPFDDHIPAARAALLQDPLLEYSDDDFYDTFRPVFERNMRFDLRLRPDLNRKSNGRNNNNNKPRKPPVLGDADTPLDQVHSFYEYWIHFESWRDFSATAADELQVEQELENAESRHEKRWYQKEIDKRAKQLKRQEMGRLSTLVERAMEADPRLRQERADKVRLKEEALEERQRQKVWQQEQQRQELELQKEIDRQQAEQAALDKVERDKEKKLVRKARQQLRKMASASFDSISINSNHNKEEASSSSVVSATNKEVSLWDDEYDRQQDVELLCTNLSLNELQALSQELEEAQQRGDGDITVQMIYDRANAARQRAEQVEQQQQQQLAADRDSVSKEDSGYLNGNSNTNSRLPWTREELSALAKSVRKYPAGGASRWDQICLFVNSLCRQAIPRTKEECIEQYNLVARGSSNNNNTNNTNSSSSNTNHVNKTSNNESETKQSATNDSSNDDAVVGLEQGDSSSGWTPVQDQQLQDALSQFPATMDKNERWSSISAAVPGKSKKQCVDRFKAIREALKKTK